MWCVFFQYWVVRRSELLQKPVFQNINQQLLSTLLTGVKLDSSRDVGSHECMHVCVCVWMFVCVSRSNNPLQFYERIFRLSKAPLGRFKDAHYAPIRCKIHIFHYCYYLIISGNFTFSYLHPVIYCRKCKLSSPKINCNCVTLHKVPVHVGKS